MEMKSYEGQEIGKNHIFLTRLFLVTGLLMLGIMLFFAASKAIWPDEKVSLLLAENSFHDIVYWTSTDVHPPLYYFILKVFMFLGNMFSLDLFFSAKLVSVIPFFLLWLLGITKIRKTFGLFCGAFYSFLIVSMPQFLHFGVEIRMYSWGLFFVTISYIYLYDIVAKKNGWIAFTIFSLCAAYTHYFAALAAGYMYIMLFLYLFRQPEQGQIKKYVISIGFNILAYLPWALVAYRQVLSVKDNYWIIPITWHRIWEYITYIFSPLDNFAKSSLLLGAGICMLVFFLIGKMLKENVSQKENFYVFTGILVFLLVILTGIFVSVVMKPVFVARYMLPSMGCLWLAFSIAFTKMCQFVKNKKVIFPLSFVFICMAGIYAFGFVGHEAENQRTYTDLYNKFAAIKQNEIRIFPDVLFLDSYNENEWMYSKAPAREVDKKFIHNKIIDSEKEINEALDAGKTVWFFTHMEDEKNLFTKLHLADRKIEKEGVYHLKVDYDGTSFNGKTNHSPVEYLYVYKIQ